MSLDAPSRRLTDELARLRKLAGLSQREVAARLKMPHSELSALEQGKVKKPSMGRLVALGAIYGLTPNEVAELGGWWTPHDQDQPDPQVQDLLRGLKQLATAKGGRRDGQGAQASPVAV